MFEEKKINGGCRHLGLLFCNFGLTPTFAVRLHMVVIFDSTFKYAAIASFLFDILLSALTSLWPKVSAIDQ